jgi:hypothetical protein
VRYAVLGLIFLPILAAGPALAGPREDSLAGISRCAALPDDRTFLDCVYGAMQPMRAELGLQPALPAQQRLVPPAYYSSRSVPPPSAQTVAPLPAPVQPGSVPPQPASSKDGMFSGMFSGSGLHMASYTFNKRGLFIVTLSDGSVWEQDPNDTNFAHFGGTASKYSVTLHPGDFGKARMNVRGEGGPYLVARIR